MFHRFYHLLEISITLASADGQEPPVESYVEVYNQNMSHQIKNMKITPVGEGEKVIVIRCNNWVDGFFFRLHLDQWSGFSKTTFQIDRSGSLSADCIEPEVSIRKVKLARGRSSGAKPRMPTWRSGRPSAQGASMTVVETAKGVSGVSGTA